MSENEKETVNETEDPLKEKVERLEAERKMVLKLASAGAKDIETAVLVGRSRLSGTEEKDIAAVVEGMKKEKAYLFGEEPTKRVVETPRRAGGAKERRQDAGTPLERAAKRAAVSGSRTDLQEYLRLRRNI